MNEVRNSDGKKLLKHTLSIVPQRKKKEEELPKKKSKRNGRIVNFAH